MITEHTPIEAEVVGKTATEVQAETKKKVIPPCTIKVEREKILMPFKHFEILKGKRADTFYPAPEVKVDNLQEILKWIGTANAVNMVQTYLKRLFQAIAIQSVNAETGLFDETLFQKYAADFTTSGMKLSEINDKLDELSAQLTKLIEAGEFTKSPEKLKELTDLNDQIRAYRQMKEDKSRKKVEEEEAAPSVQAE